MPQANDFDVIVVGAGHAGCEAAAAASAMGLRTCLMTIHLDTIAQMSCNPAIGGLAKGHLVREIDALGGLMGLLADETGIQFRLLNRSRGGAVQAPRAQCDKAAYRLAMKRRLESMANLTVFQGIVSEVVVTRGAARGVKTLDGAFFEAKAVILTPGTFLNGLIHIGLTSYPAGRANEPPSVDLAEQLKRLGLKVIRLKTGTPMRLDRDTIEWDRFSPQAGDKEPVPFSYRTRARLENKVLCHLGYTNAGHACRHPPQPRQVAPLWGKDQGHRAALLPVDRGQGRQVPSPGPPPVLPGAGGDRNDRGLCQRHVLQPALSRSSGRSSRRYPALTGPRS